MTITHITPADNSFTPQGKSAWNADHSITSVDISSGGGITVAQTAETVGVQILTDTLFTANSAPFQVHQNSFPNQGGGSGTFNHGVFYGYNVTRHSVTGSTTANKPSLIMGMEDSYYDNGGDNTFGSEWYVEHWSSDGTTVQMLRPFYTRVRNANNSDNSCTTLLNIGNDGTGQFDVRSSVTSSILNLTISTAKISQRLTVVGGAQIQQTDNSVVMDFPSSGGVIDMGGVLRGANGSNLDTVYRNGNAAGLWKFNNAANSVQVMSLSDGGFLKIASTATPSLAFLPAASAGVIYAGGTASTLIFYPVQATAASGSGGTFTFRNNESEGGTHMQILATAGVSSVNFVQITGASAAANASIKTNAENLLFGAGAALNVTSASGYVMFPSCAGTPTGVPTGQGAGKIPMIFDTSGVKLWFYTGGSWKGVVVS